MTDSLLELGQRHLLGYLPITTAANITLPLTWYMIGTQVSCMEMTNTPNHPPQMIYPRGFKILQMLYEGTDQVLDYIPTIIHQLRIRANSLSDKEAEAQPLSRSPKKNSYFLHSHTSPAARDKYVVIYNFAHCSPGEYVRISKTTDVSLAIGRFPERTELPAALQSLIIDSRLYRALLIPESCNELLTSTWGYATASDKSELGGINIDSLLGDYSQWDNLACEEDSAMLTSPPAGDTALGLRPTTLDHFPTAEEFGVFSNTSSSEDLDSLFPLTSNVEAADTTGDKAMGTLFP
ncbi:hypothetical protein BJX63DRAFT_431999 [Aspergillus granulosus]|uniref:Uncharacterized protein n=1 Tax=Aspergillus granulosus TaxID=176169 RepID=A0ABR4HDB7_9EURO